MASIRACSRPRAASGLAIISGVFFARRTAAACNRWSFIIADRGGVWISGFFGGVRSTSAIAALSGVTIAGPSLFIIVINLDLLGFVAFATQVRLCQVGPPIPQ